MKTVIVSHRYPVPIERLWSSVVSYTDLKALATGEADLSEIPDREARPGDRFDVPLKLFGIEAGQYHIKIVARDDTRHMLQSHEHGGPIKLWDHTLTLEPIGEEETLYTDRVEIEAGAFTWLTAQKAKSLYRARHQGREALIRGQNQAPTMGQE